MPAPISRPTVDRIIAMHEQGAVTAAEIARRLGLSPGTVSKYIRGHESERSVALAPAATLSEMDIAMFRALMDYAFRVVRCGACGTEAMLLRWSKSAACGGCGVRLPLR